MYKNINWHTLSIPKVLKKLNTSKKGLSFDQVEKNQDKYGFNILAKADKFSISRLILSQFKSALIYILLIAGLISIFFKEYVDAYVIFAAVLLNVVVGFIQEFKANKSLEKLNKVVKKETLVIRDNQEMKIESKYLVPGDIIVLESGDRIPADARILSINALEINEASLTGESWPIKKELEVIDVGTVLAERNNMVFMGTLVVEGRGQAIVVATGYETEMGKITVMLKETKEDKTPLQKKLDDFAKNITKIILVVSLILFIIGVLKGHEWSEMFIISVAVAVSAIPEGLVISMTMILTVGMQRILKSNGLVRRLISAETLGSTTVICTDKTGTLTEGEMRVTQVVSASQQVDLSGQSFKDIKIDKELKKLLQVSLLCNDAVVENIKDNKDEWRIIGSPTEKALLLFGTSGLSISEENKNLERKDEIPFDSQRKYMVSRHKYNSTHDIIFLKGAPEKVIYFSSKYLQDSKDIKLNKIKINYFRNQWERLSKEGLRVLAGSYKLIPKKTKDIGSYREDPEDFIFVGVWGLSDPLRPETIDTLHETFKAGITTVIITGDNKFTAQKIAKDLGLSANNKEIVTGDELLKMSDKELEERVRSIKIYARVSPADKLRIIKAWQDQGEIVSMTGDGVNDAPALKAADIGVAVSSGSDVAKETADLVLLDNNFKTIVMAIRQGRVIFANIKKVILYLLSDSFSEIIIIIGSMIIGMPLPLVTAQILWINLVSDGFPALALTMEPEEDDIMKKKVDKIKSIFNFEGKVLVVIISLVTSITSLGLFYYFWKETGDIVLARTVTFTTLGIDTLFYVFSIKSLDKNIFKSKPFRNKYLNFAVILGLLIQLSAIYIPFLNRMLRTVPLHWSEWKVMILVMLVVFVLIEVIKSIFIHHRNKKYI